MMSTEKDKSAGFDPTVGVERGRLDLIENIMQMAAEKFPDLSLIPPIKYDEVRRYPHDPKAFTEGLDYHEGFLYESTGRRGSSSLRRIDAKTGELKDMRSLDKKFFAEGLTVLNGKIFQLTYTDQVCFVYDLKTMCPLHKFSYKGEGWGLTNDGYHLIMSNHTAQLLIIDPNTFQMAGKPISVSANGEPVETLNELEHFQGSIFANVFLRSFVVRIDKTSGQINGLLDLSALQPANGGVLNGIAYNEDSGNCFVTGKNWDVLFEIHLK